MKDKTSQPCGSEAFILASVFLEREQEALVLAMRRLRWDHGGQSLDAPVALLFSCLLL